MSAIDPRLIAWLDGAKPAQDAQEFRRQLASLERSAGVAAQNVRQDLNAVEDRVEAVEAQIGQAPVVYANRFIPVSGSFGAPNQFYDSFTFPVDIVAGWATAGHQSSLAFSSPLGQFYLGDTVFTCWNCYSPGTLAINYFGVLAP